MEDTYEIGIRLALDNGVSAGIAALKNDLAAYDRAVETVTGRLRGAREIVREPMPPVSPAVRDALNRQPQVVEVAKAPEGGAGEQRAALPPMPLAPHRPVLPTRMAGPAPESRPVVRIESAPMRTAPGVAVAVAPQRLFEAPRRPVPNEKAPVPVAMSGRQPSDYPSHAPVLPAMLERLPRTPETRSNRQAPIPAPNASAAPRMREAAREPDRPPVVERSQPSSGPAAPVAAPGQQMQDAPMAVAEPAAGATTAAAAGSAQGDIYLDGARIGRWMIEHLTREVDRPQTGMTGFDPRLSPTWAGSLHGT